MSRNFMLACLWLVLVSTVFPGQTTSTTATSVLSAGEKVVETLQRIESALKSKQTGLSGPLFGRAMELLAFSQMKEKTLETYQKAMETYQKAAEKNQEAVETKLKAMEAKLEAAERERKEMKTKLEETALDRSNQKGGSTFVRWGKKTCANTSQLVYSGVAGGSWYDHTGAAANPLCLTLAPQFDGTAAHPTYRGYLYGAEYELIPNHHEHDVPCSVCRTALSTTIMIPATRTCPTGWTTQYTGYLTSGHYGHKAASEYVCLDNDPENASSGHVNHNGYLFYFTVTQCGSLPCPPYVNNKVVLCVVCSK
ncbi:short-chain collagen C4-like [Babylonia areolata]|uniref:short-chain collagen C4-like n=1 Tax=Babylonia areolata TaxID=304850 RepID=UPI003FCFC7DD